jgi:hypothetical protein
MQLVIGMEAFTKGGMHGQTWGSLVLLLSSASQYVTCEAAVFVRVLQMCRTCSAFDGHGPPSCSTLRGD